MHSIRDKAALKFGSEVWVLKRGDEQILEAAKIKFLRHLLEILNLIGQGIYPLGYTGCAEHCSGIEELQQTLLQTLTENGHKDDTQAGTVV